MDTGAGSAPGSVGRALSSLPAQTALGLRLRPARSASGQWEASTAPRPQWAWPHHTRVPPGSSGGTGFESRRVPVLSLSLSRFRFCPCLYRDPGPLPVPSPSPLEPARCPGAAGEARAAPVPSGPGGLWPRGSSSLGIRLFQVIFIRKLFQIQDTKPIKRHVRAHIGK